MYQCNTGTNLGGGVGKKYLKLEMCDNGVGFYINILDSEKSRQVELRW